MAKSTTSTKRTLIVGEVFSCPRVFSWSRPDRAAMIACRCEYIFYRGLYRTSYARISRGYVTDTEMQIGQFVVPKHGSRIGDDTFSARYIRSYKETLHPDHVCDLSTSCFLSTKTFDLCSGSRWSTTLNLEERMDMHTMCSAL